METPGGNFSEEVYQVKIDEINQFTWGTSSRNTFILFFVSELHVLTLEPRLYFLNEAEIIEYLFVRVISTQN